MNSAKNPKIITQTIHISVKVKKELRRKNRIHEFNM